MGAKRTTQTLVRNESAYSTPNHVTNPVSARNLTKNNLGGVIFGCKNSTIKECLSKKLFGLPEQHFLYVKNIDPGLPLFLFNYSDRKLHGIFEAASSGQLNINPCGWTTDGSGITPYPAQVQIRVRWQCRPLPECEFKPIILDNYYYRNHFSFELNHAQTSMLLSSLSSVALSSSAPQSTTKWRIVSQELPLADRTEENEGFKPRSLEADFSHSLKSNENSGSSDDALYGNKQPSEGCLGEQVVEKDENDLICMKLEELALNHECSDSPFVGNVEDRAVGDFRSIIPQLVKEMQELKASKTEHYQKMGCLEQKLVAAEIEIQQLKARCLMLESMWNPSMHQDPDASILLVGGYDGVSYLSTLDCYSPSHDVIKSLKPMYSVRLYASVAKLNGELYVCGGGDNPWWYDTVDSYNPANNQWTSRPPLNEKKGSLAGATLNNKIFAIGGTNWNGCFPDVEMYDVAVGRWIPTQPMLQKRFALAAAELNGVLYAVGGHDGKDYLSSAERFDPREHSWTRIASMNTKRGSHSMVVLNEKLYALGGYDGNATLSCVEVFDPRLGSWISGKQMNQSRGYFAAAVLNESIYVVGGVRIGEDIILDTVERYEEGRGWQVINPMATGKRCFCSAIVL